jgi:hypothetical protein
VISSAAAVLLSTSSAMSIGSVARRHAQHLAAHAVFLHDERFGPSPRRAPLVVDRADEERPLAAIRAGARRVSAEATNAPRDAQAVDTRIDRRPLMRPVYRAALAAVKQLSRKLLKTGHLIRKAGASQAVGTPARW